MIDEYVLDESIERISYKNADVLVLQSPNVQKFGNVSDPVIAMILIAA